MLRFGDELDVLFTCVPTSEPHATPLNYTHAHAANAVCCPCPPDQGEDRTAHVSVEIAYGNSTHQIMGACQRLKGQGGIQHAA